MKRSELPRSCRFAYSLLPVLVLMSLTVGVESYALPAGDELPDPQRSGGIALPVWGVGESREGFDIRIWPEEVLAWLEMENLRDLISDPEVPEDEKKALREVLAQQRSWNKS